MYITRGLEDRLKRLSRYFPAVAVSGARQTGKTTLLRHCFPEYDYVSLDLPSKAEQAELNPTGFLREHTAPVVIESLAGRIGMLDPKTQRVPAKNGYLHRNEEPTIQPLPVSQGRHAPAVDCGRFRLCALQ